MNSRLLPVPLILDCDRIQQAEQGLHIPVFSAILDDCRLDETNLESEFGFNGNIFNFVADLFQDIGNSSIVVGFVIWDLEG